MNESTKEQRVIQAMHEHAEREVPDDQAAWSSIQSRLLSAGHSLSEIHTFTIQPAPKAISDGKIRPASNRLKISLAMVLVVALGLTALAIAAFGRDNARVTSSPPETGSDFVPAGKVRHVVISDTWSISSLFPPESRAAQRSNAKWRPSPRLQDLWYTNGQNHLHLYLTFTYLPQGGVKNTTVEATWIDEEAIYNLNGNTVMKSLYSPRYFELYGPYSEMITKTLELPGSRVVRETILNGRPAVEIQTRSMEFKSNQTPVSYPLVVGSVMPTPEPPSFSEERHIADFHRWIDKETHQLLQWQNTVTYISGQQSGEVETHTSTLILDELRGLSEFPPDFFKFKLPEGATLEEWDFPGLPTRTPRPTP